MYLFDIFHWICATGYERFEVSIDIDNGLTLGDKSLPKQLLAHFTTYSYADELIGLQRQDDVYCRLSSF